MESLDYLDYLRYRRDAFIHKLNETEAGREYLANAHRLEQTSLSGAGRSRLRELFGASASEGSDDASHKHFAG